MAQSVEHLTLDFSSGHDLTVCGIKSHVRLCADSAEPAGDSLSPSLCLCPSPTLSHSRKKQKKTDEQEVARTLDTLERHK